MGIVTIRNRLQKMTGVDRVLLGVVFVGAVVAAVALFRGILVDRQVQVEILNDGEVAGTNVKMFLIDIEGAVINPGVYELTAGSRIKDVLVSAGGLSEKADRDFCEKNLNMAELVKDGQKIYIPSKGNTDADRGYFEASIQSKKVNINTASVTELDTLWGIGQSRAESIVKNRPYKSLDELVSKGAMSKSILEKNKDVLTVY